MRSETVSPQIERDCFSNCPRWTARVLDQGRSPPPSRPWKKPQACGDSGDGGDFRLPFITTPVTLLRRYRDSFFNVVRRRRGESGITATTAVTATTLHLPGCDGDDSFVAAAIWSRKANSCLAYTLCRRSRTTGRPVYRRDYEPARSRILPGDAGSCARSGGPLART
jgi:hypothetical protein